MITTIGVLKELFAGWHILSITTRNTSKASIGYCKHEGEQCILIAKSYRVSSEMGFIEFIKVRNSPERKNAI